ncbi:MAG: SphA family protein [Gammaproteobacteria bacterium]
MAVAPESKWTLRNDVYYYTADSEESVRSGRVELGADLEFLFNFTTLLYKTDTKIFGGEYAFGAFMPLLGYTDVSSSLKIGNTEAEVEDDQLGLGDIALIPWIIYWNKGNFHWSFAEFVVVPTGNYDEDEVANTGLNYWSFDTNFALTYLNAETGQDYSFNAGYIINTENSDTNYQTGNEFHLDVSLNQFLSERFALGLQGFWLKQLSGDSGSGAVLGSNKAEVYGLGPTALWAAEIDGQPVIFIAKWLHEFDADNRIEGDHFMASFAVDW